jgi:hypothetical protein
MVTVCTSAPFKQICSDVSEKRAASIFTVIDLVHVVAEVAGKNGQCRLFGPNYFSIRANQMQSL